MAIQGMQTPVSRIVWGNPGRSVIKKDQRTKQPILRDGKPVEQWAFGAAFPKHEFEQFIKPYFEQEARSAYPHGVPQGFSWKFKDGDGVDRQGKPYNTREGYAGHYVLNISTEAFAPPIFKRENGVFRQVLPEEIKTGDYIALNLNVKVNVPTDPTHTPGLYVNPNGIELVGFGPAIQNSANPDEMFSNQQYQLPPGASATPVMASGSVGMPLPQQQQQQPMQQPQQYIPQQQPQGYPQPAPAPMAPAMPQGYPQQQQYQPAPAASQGYPQPAPVQLPPPAHDFVQNAGNVAGYAAAPQAPIAAPVYAGTATGFPSNPPQQAPATPQGYPQMAGLPQSR